MSESLARAKARLREAVAASGSRGLDHAVAEVEAALAALWILERGGSIPAGDVPGLVRLAESYLRKLAPPPPRRVKFSDPLRKILPLAESSVRPALDAAMFLLALTQVGEFTKIADKARATHEAFLDDWRRMIWESARIADWARFRELAGTEERILEGRLSREAALALLEALARRRTDRITPLPDLSILACARCGRFRGRDRIRCDRCKGTFCARCSARTTELCLADYAARYAPIAPEKRIKIARDARTILRRYRLDEHTYNEAFVRALHEEGVDVVFSEHAPPEGQESEVPQGRRRLLMRDREGPGAKRILFASLGRCYFRAAGEGDRLIEEFFVDACLGVPIEDALGTPSPASS